MTARTFVAFSLSFLLSIFFRTFFAVVGPELSRDLLLSPFQFGVLSSAFFAGFAAMQVPVGLLFDRFGCRLPMTALAICGAAGSAMIATTTSFAQALLGQGLLGIGCAPALMGILPLWAGTSVGEGGAGRDHNRRHRLAWSFSLCNAARAPCFNGRMAVRGGFVGLLYDLGIWLAQYLSR
ncbi:MFS transporter [Rhizobium phaseoli]|uniref:MFS transporter n=1 Tax=Rhizobium phaseoli TaxID=396 RepID=UPI0007EC0CC6|nr:MFS transporter [Rhizobium phaseoli]